MLILNLKPTLKQASPLLLPPAVLFYLYWFLNVIFLFERLGKDWTLARISISNSQTMFTSAQIWLQNLIKFDSKTNFFFFKALFEGLRPNQSAQQSAQWNTWHNKGAASVVHPVGPSSQERQAFFATQSPSWVTSLTRARGKTSTKSSSRVGQRRQRLGSKSNCETLLNWFIAEDDDIVTVQNGKALFGAAWIVKQMLK